jgi:type VI secretion system protein ImpB
MSANSGQKFIKRNRAPRVHIEYAVETNGSRENVSLPFVAGVLSDLSGKSTVEKKALEDRDFVEFDNETFDKKMEAMAPRVTFAVENTLSGEGNLPIDITFKSMDDFNPGAVATQVPALAKMLDARNQIRDLMLHIDGKDKAQALIDRMLKDPELMKSLSAADSEADDKGA